MVDGILAVRGITGSIGDEDAIKMMSYFMDGIVVGECGNRCATRDKTAENILLDTAINYSNMQVAARGDMKRGFRADGLYQIDTSRINESLIFIRVVFCK